MDDRATGPTLDSLLHRWRQVIDLVPEAEACHRLETEFGRLALTQAAGFALPAFNASNADLILALLRHFQEPALLDRLAEHLSNDSELPLEVLWPALELLDEFNRLGDFPALRDRRDEINELLDAEDATADALADHLEGAPEEVWVALQGFENIEPEVQREILLELGEMAPLGHGLAEFLRLLAHAENPRLRHDALDALALEPLDEDPERARAWHDLALHHAHSEVRDRARSVIGDPQTDRGQERASETSIPLVTSLVTALDGQGQGQIAFLAFHPDRGTWTAAVYFCDVEHGVLDVIGQTGLARQEVDALLDDYRGGILDVVEPAHGLALGLLAETLNIARPSNPAYRFWFERTIGTAPVEGATSGWSPSPPGINPDSERTIEPDAQAGLVLDSCPDWLDRSSLTRELAEELLFRHGSTDPDPIRDAGAYRFLFERILSNRLDPYRRMLSWMGCFWDTAGSPHLASSALALANQLADPQHHVPSHLFTVELITRSLRAAQHEILEERADDAESIPSRHRLEDGR